MRYMAFPYGLRIWTHGTGLGKSVEWYSQAFLALEWNMTGESARGEWILGF